MRVWIMRICALLMILVMYKLSSTSSLQVIDPQSWTNESQYQENLETDFLFDRESRFYEGYFQYEDAIYQASPNFFAHKLSHILFYSILTILIFFSFQRFNKIGRTWLIIVTLALLDEINQYFIIGRTGLFIDVLLDGTASALTLLSLFFVIVVNRVRKKEKTKK